LVKTSSIFQKIPSRKYNNNEWNKLVKYHKKRKKKRAKWGERSKTIEEGFAEVAPKIRFFFLEKT